MKDEQKESTKTALKDPPRPRRFHVKRSPSLDAQTQKRRLSIWERLYLRLAGADPSRELGWDWDRTAPLAQRARVLATLAAGFVISALISLASLSFGAYPVGFALICAVGADKRVFSFLGQSAFCAAAVAGVLVSCVFVSEYPFVQFCVCCATFLVRLILTSGLLNEPAVIRSTVSTFAAALYGVVCCAWEGFTLPAVFRLVTVTVLAPVACYLFCGLTADPSEEGGLAHFECALLAVASLCVYSLNPLSLWGFSPAFVGALVFTFGVARMRGPVYGAVAGLAAGLACGNVLYGCVMGLSGFFSGLFFASSQWMGLAMSFVISAGFSLFGAGFSSFGTVADDYLLACLLYYPLRSLFGAAKTKDLRLLPLEVSRNAEAFQRAKGQLERLSDAFCSLSEVFYTVSKQSHTPDLTEVSALVSECCSRICSSCPHSELCWGNSYDSAGETSFAVSGALLRKGVAQAEDLPQRVRDKCPRRGELLERINAEFAAVCSRCFRDNRTELLAGEYSTVARLLKSTAGDVAAQSRRCQDLEPQAQRLLRRLGISFSRVQVTGRRQVKIDVFGVHADTVKASAERIRQEAAREFGCPFEEPSFLFLERRAVMRLQQKRKLVLECAKACRAKNGEAVNGDTSGFFESEGDQFYSMICDGMGSGRDAAITSRLAQIFIEKLAGCSSPHGITLEMLNGFLLAKNNECFTTVDLLEVDLLNGEGSFIKAGAAPSFVLRGDNLFRITSQTPPAGILPQMSAEQTRLELRPGDLVVMISDGILQGEDAEHHLCQQITFAPNKSPAALAAAILAEASARQQAADDMTVFVLSVKEAA